MASNIGMMDSAYFVGRNEILSWVNARLHLNLSRVEEAASGAVQCQMMDMTYPGVVPMHKVNFDAKTEYDMIQNYKVLQDVFNKLKIDKVNLFWVSVTTTVTAFLLGSKNLQTYGQPAPALLGWLAGLTPLNASVAETDALRYPAPNLVSPPPLLVVPLPIVSNKVYLLATIGFESMTPAHIEVNKLVKGRPLDNLEFLQWLKRYCDTINGGIMNENYNPVERRSKVGKERHSKGFIKNSKSLQANNAHNPCSVDGMGINKINGAKQGKTVEIQALTKEITELKLSVDMLEKERDFYFAKLRDIEILCQTPELEHFPMALGIKKILYAADAKESALAEAQEILRQSGIDEEDDNDEDDADADEGENDDIRN
ncbi:hypothetical protein LguiB_022857 [Lonicera macranthoides]